MLSLLLLNIKIRLQRAWHGLLLRDPGYALAETALGLVQKQNDIIDGLNSGYGLLEAENNANYRAYMVNMASMLMASGGTVQVSKDIIKTVQESNIGIDTDISANDYVVIKLVSEEEAVAAADHQEYGDPVG